jgi:hypothetical protein
MSMFTYLVPLLVVGGMALYYLRIYQKGKAAGGGMMAGFAATAHEKWHGVLLQGETIQIFGAGVLARPYWQALLASQIPLLRLVWPTISYQLCVTDRGRLLIGKYGMVGTLSDQKAYARPEVKLDRIAEEKPGLAMKLNPLYRAFGQEHKTYTLMLGLPDDAINLACVTGTIVNSFRSATMGMS